MRSHILRAGWVGGLAFAAAAIAAPAASASHGASAAHVEPGLARPVPNVATCYSQGRDLDGNGISSQNYGAQFAVYTDQAADDFTLVRACKVQTVVVSGHYSEDGGPAVSENVTFYRNADGVPGAVVRTYTKRGTDSSGTFTIHLGKHGHLLRKGTYWLSVQTNQDFSTSGEWSWETAVDGAGGDAQWQQPGDGFGLGCTTWCDARVFNPTNPNLSFSILGKS